MSSNDDGNVIDFGRRTGLTGFTLTPVPPSTPDTLLTPAIPPQPDTAPSNGTGEQARRSPLDLVAALPSPTLLTPPVPAAANPEPGLPATFRNNPEDGEPTVGPRLGALSMAAILAVAVAALRGSCIFLEDRRQRAMEKRAESAPMREARLKHQLAMAEHGWNADEAAAKGRTDVAKAREKAASKQAKNNKVPSGTEFGRKTLGNRGGGGSSSGGKSGGSAGGAGRGGGKSTPNGPGSGSKTPRGTGAGGGLGGGTKKNRTGNGPGASGNGLGAGAKTKKNRGSGSGSGLGTGSGGSSKKHGKGTGTGSGSGGTAGMKDKGGKKSPHRTSQGAGHTLGSGSGGRTRKERAAARQDGRLQRKADRQAARLGEHAKDRKAARDHKYAPKQARQDRKNRIRDARADAKEARRENIRQAKHDAKQDQKAAKAAAKRLKKAEAALEKEKTKHAADGRTKLWDALKNDTADAVRGRWGRRGDRVPPLWKNDKKRDKKTKTPKPPKDTTGPGRKDKRRKARDRARDAWGGFGKPAADDCFGGTTPPSGAGTTNGGGPTHGPGPAGGPRRSPYGNAASASTTAAGTEWTVERDDRPTPGTGGTGGPTPAIGRGIDALPPAPEPHTKRPGTTRPKEPIAMSTAPVPAHSDPRLKSVRTQAVQRARAVVKQARHMDPQHETEITLDDACDEYEGRANDAFKTHKQARKLAERSRNLANTLDAFAEELATTNNIIGALFTGAMANLVEDMELVASAFDAMEGTSLNAAEHAEANSNDLDDAYRPISDATADAGLVTPSAPVHNQT